MPSCRRVIRQLPSVSMSASGSAQCRDRVDNRRRVTVIGDVACVIRGTEARSTTFVDGVLSPEREALARFFTSAWR